MLNKYTFGSSPAAIYLAENLNIINNSKLNRKVSSFINSIRAILTQSVNANEAGIINVKTLYFIVDALSERVKWNRSRLSLDAEWASYQLIVDLTANILIGEIKSIKRRAQKVAHVNHMQAQLIGSCHNMPPLSLRNNDNVIVAEIGPTIQLANVSVNDIEDPTNDDVLIARSKKRLQRLGKTDTLY